MAIVRFKYGTLIYGQQNIQGTFNADINTKKCRGNTNASLTLRIRICFQQINPTASIRTRPDHDKKEVPIKTWKAKEWLNWKRKFVKICQKKWNGKFWLETPLDYSGLNWPTVRPTHRCNLYCRFAISEQSNPSGAHAIIPVVKIGNKQIFRSDMLNYSSMDIKYPTCSHEIGHLIGLDHPGRWYWFFAGCIEDGEDICYYDSNGNDDGLMGAGNKIYKEYAKPWLTAASILTETSKANWKVHTRYISPKKIK